MASVDISAIQNKYLCVASVDDSAFVLYTTSIDDDSRWLTIGY